MTLTSPERKADLLAGTGVWATGRAVGRVKHTPAIIADLFESTSRPEQPSFAPVPLFGRRRRDSLAITLFAIALLLGGTVGFLRGVQHGRGDALIGAAMAASLTSTVVDKNPGDELIPAIGRLHAEILRLRVLFRRLATVAELDDGEFDLELDAESLPSVRSAMEGLDLSIRALDPISLQSAQLTHVYEDRRAAFQRRIGGTVAPGTFRTSGFGLRMHPVLGRRQLHRGIDFAGLPGTPVHALAEGVVAFSGRNGAYGNLIEIEHGDGYRTRYAHNQRNLVAAGKRVGKGEAIALLGSTGRSTGAHVHVEVREHGMALDPEAFVH